MAGSELGKLAVESMVSALLLFGQGVLLAAIVFLGAYLYLRRQQRKGKHRRYTWR